MADFPRSMPAAEYRTLWERLAAMRARDPDNRELLRLALKFSRIGQRADAAHATYKAGAERNKHRIGSELDPTFDWAHADIPLTPEDAAVIERVATLTVVPE